MEQSMAKIYHEMAYIEAHEDDVDNFSIEITYNGILVGKSAVQPVIWLWTDTNEDGDLIINNSAGMEPKKWDHITKEIIANA
jgi:hypothetical protein